MTFPLTFCPFVFRCIPKTTKRDLCKWFEAHKTLDITSTSPESNSVISWNEKRKQQQYLSTDLSLSDERPRKRLFFAIYISVYLKFNSKSHSESVIQFVFNEATQHIVQYCISTLKEATFKAHVKHSKGNQFSTQMRHLDFRVRQWFKCRVQGSETHPV